MPTDARVAQVVAEALRPLHPDLRVAQVPVEVIETTRPPVAVAQTVCEVLRQNRFSVVIAQAAAEVLTANAPNLPIEPDGPVIDTLSLVDTCDAEVVPAFVPCDTAPYASLITSEHNQKPNYMAAVEALLRPLCCILDELAAIPLMFDVDTALGQQLDIVGLWVGATRNVYTPLTGVYFSFDTPGLGFDEGVWYGPFDALTGLTVLPDEHFRTLIKAHIAANNWDGTIGGARAIWDFLFAGQGLTVIIQDNEDMSMLMGLLSSSGQIDAVTKALFGAGYLDLKPCGVQIVGHVIPSGTGPFFGFDVSTTAIAGFDVGSWATSL
jgi:hypothetical protein